MYVGSTSDGSGLHHLLWEVVGNSLDEHLAGHATYVRIRTCGATVSVEDDGRGIPVDPHPRLGIPALEVVLTRLHAGTTRRPHVHIAPMLRGVGLAVVNALSASLEAEVWRDGRASRQRFARGEAVSGLEDLGPASRRGTRITFEPDFTIFTPLAWDHAQIRERMQELAAMNPTLTTMFEREAFRCPDGLADLVGGEPVHLRSSRDGIDVEIALLWTEAGEPIVRGFVGQARAGGTHVDGFERGLRDAFRELDPRYKRAANADVDGVAQRGLVAYVSVTLEDPRFANPSREWLANPEVGDAVRAAVVEGLRARWPHDPALRDRLLERT